MCGIAAVVGVDALGSKDVLNAMVAALNHRGPDGQGTMYFDKCALGHTRLSIVDIQGGSQPMQDEKSGVAISFNGEIYGYMDLLKEHLDSSKLKTKSDTEILLHMYIKYGEDCLKYIKGMFAFIIYDNRNKKVFCARDHFGQKPLYYSRTKEGSFVFASEVKALLASGHIDRVIDENSLCYYLKHLTVPANKSIFKSINVLPAAHALVIENGKIKTWRYWKQPETNIQIKKETIVETFKEKLEQSIKEHLVADVPVAAFLSGGCDSSTVVALASCASSNLKTFSYGFEDDSELPYAKQIAQLYNTDHYESFDKQIDLVSLVQKMSQIYDEPFADSSNIPTFLLCEQARKHSKVMLGGDGADELLGGYVDAYRSLVYMQNFSKDSDWMLKLKRIVFKLLSRITAMNDFNNKSTACLYRLRGENEVYKTHLNKYQYFSDEDLSLINMKSMGSDEIQLGFEPDSSVQDALKVDIENYMVSDILTKVDRASMANGLEVRSPFLDLDLAEWIISLPIDYKINESRDKILLRDAYQEKWSQDVTNRKKQGFGAPVNNWLNQKSMSEFVSDHIKSKNLIIHDYFPQKYVENVIGDKNYRSWSLLTLSLWMEKYCHDN
jgi:asparagine synthase (glutamine-hydrolysing)